MLRTFVAMFLYLLPVSAFAAEAILPITVTIIQCGKKEDLEKACQKEPKCCKLIEDKKEEDPANE